MTTVIQPDPAPVEMPASPWHAGERLLQEHVGVAARMAQIGPKVLRDYMPDQHRDFYAQLPLLLAGAVDPAGDPWAGALEGEPGFAGRPTPECCAWRPCRTPMIPWRRDWGRARRWACSASSFRRAGVTVSMAWCRPGTAGVSR